MLEAAVELDDEALAAYLDGKEPDEATLKRHDPQGRADRRVLSRAVRLGLQEQGRAAAARRGGGLSAVAGRRARHQGHRRRRQRSGPASERQGTAGAARVQDHGRPVCRHHHLLPHLFGHAAVGYRRRQFDARPQGAHRPHVVDACQQPRRHQGSLCRRHRGAGGPQGSAHRRYAVRSQQAGDPGKDGIPGAGDRDRDRAEVEGRPGKARRRAGEACRGRSVVPGLDRSGIRPDHSQGHGRTPSRHQGRHPAPDLQGRRQYRRAAGGVP